MSNRGMLPKIQIQGKIYVNHVRRSLNLRVGALKVLSTLFDHACPIFSREGAQIIPMSISSNESEVIP